MMFARLAPFVSVASLALLAAATPNQKRWDTPTPTVTVTVTATPPVSTPPASSCSTGPIQCCNSLESASSAAGSLLLGLLGIIVDGVDVLLGLDCSPISVIGVGGGNCNANVVCCENNNVGGLISVGCIPVIL
ncbi:fungal hydrophobin [Cubamyces sp. BRFM 1775]|nr:fungal hydrophobin [Cubamyces sp. BRFM 1775]